MPWHSCGRLEVSVSLQALQAPLTPDELRGPLYWVLEVEWSTPLVWATDPVTIPKEAGGGVACAGGLQVSFTRAVEWFGEVPGEAEASFTGLRGPVGMNMGALVLAGHALAGVTAQLSQWAPGRAWEERNVVLRGVVRTPAVGGVDEPLSLTVRAERRTDLPKDPLPSERVSLDTWSYLTDADGGTPRTFTLPADSDGKYYPIVYGLPGWVEAEGRVIRIPSLRDKGELVITTYARGGGSPVTLVHVNYDYASDIDTTPGGDAKVLAVINNGPTVSPVDFVTGEFGQNKVTIMNVTKGETWENRGIIIENAGIIPAFDNFAQRVTLVDLTLRFTRVDDPWAPGDDLWCVWAGAIGSTPGREVDAGLRGAGEVMEHALQHGGAVVDNGGWAAVREEMNSYKIDTYRDKPIDAWDWVASEVLPLVPLGVLDGAKGLTPVLWRWDAIARDTMGHVVSKRLGTERMGQPAAWEDWTNQVRVNYRPHTSGRDFNAAAVISGAPIVVAAGRLEDAGGGLQAVPLTQHPTTGAAASRATYGSREARVVDAVALNDKDSAERVAAFLMAAFAFPGLVIKMRDKGRAWAHVPEGAPLLFSDDELGWDRRLVWLISRQWDDTHPTMTLLYLKDPAREL